MKSTSDRLVKELVENLKPRVIVPRHFDLWSRTLQIAWMRANQKRKTKDGSN
jgi:hypothetical protein